MNWPAYRAARRCLTVSRIAVLAVMPLALTSCVPYLGPVSPASLNFSNGAARIILCISDIEIDGLRIEYREVGGDYILATRTSSDDDPSGIKFSVGDGFQIGKPLGSLAFDELVPLPADSKFDNISVRVTYVSSDGEGFTWPNFRNVDPSRLSEDQYLYEDGEVSDQPCGMYG